MFMIQLLNSNETNLYFWIPLLLLITIAIVVFTPIIFRFFSKWFTSIGKVSTKVLTEVAVNNETVSDTLDEAIQTAGYSYNPKKDIFYSNMNAWQRKMGYCRLYDEAAAPLGMIVDCEPIYFSYHEKRWLIEFWKGQYDLTTGCEVGIYTTDGPDLNIPGIFNGTFYNCANDEDRLFISYSLKRHGKVILTRKDKHWWATGFKLGEFSEPSELMMDIYITFKNKSMRNEFVSGLREAGYTDNEFYLNGTTVAIRFDKPHTPQPYTRTDQTDKLIQKKNKLLCDKYQSITGDYDNLPDKINAIKQEDPELYDKALNIGKTKQLFDMYKIINKYLN